MFESFFVGDVKKRYGGESSGGDPPGMGVGGQGVGSSLGLSSALGEGSEEPEGTGGGGVLVCENKTESGTQSSLVTAVFQRFPREENAGEEGVQWSLLLAVEGGK